MADFDVMDCALLTSAPGLPPATNLRELRDRLVSCDEQVLYHHFCETILRPSFDDPEYRNDFAVWAKEGLMDKVLAERLGIIDPYEYQSLADLRHQVVERVEDRLAELAPWVPSVRQGSELYFLKAITVTFHTGHRIRTPLELARNIEHFTEGSLYFHFFEGRRRSPDHADDFTTWLRGFGDSAHPVMEAIADIDFYFKSLAVLRKELSRAMKIAVDVPMEVVH